MHQYLGVDDNLIWVMVNRSVPNLVPQLHTLLAEHDEQDDTHAT